jgi:hypothetical protein
VREHVNSIEDVQAATMQADCHDMVPPPDEHQLLLLKLLESMPSSEHEQFLGNKLYSLVQVHTTRIYWPFGNQTGIPAPALAWQAVDPARAGKIAGMLLELDVHLRVVPLNIHQVVALIVFPDMVRSTSPKATACTRPPAPGCACGAAAT